MQKKSRREVTKITIHHREFAFAIASGLLTLIAFFVENYNQTIAITLYLAAFVIGGYETAKEGLLALWKEREFGVDLLMIIAAIGAGAIGYWLEGALLIFIFALSGALETYTMARSEKDLSSLLQLQPEVATLVTADGKEHEVPVNHLKIDDQVLVRPGGRIPVDGRVIRGSSAVDQATITGESIPVSKRVDDEVYAGTINGSGALLLQVTATNEHSLFSKIVKLVERARTEVPKSQQKMERLERTYAKVVLLLTAVLLIAPHFLFDWNWEQTFYRAMVFLVVASPCALVASIMPAVLSAMSKSSRQGILFKNGMQLETLADVRAVAFDKTGTLTTGKPTVTNIQSAIDEDDLLHAVMAIEWLSEHPLAKSLVSYAAEQGVTHKQVEQFQAESGFGVRAVYQGKTWRIGKPAWFTLHDKHHHTVQTWEAQGKTVIVVEREGEIVGILALRDTIREDAKQLIGALRARGIHTVMLTGDQPRTAEAIAAELGIDEVYSGLLPQEKVDNVRTLRQRFSHVAMVGDGVNDAPALSQASMGIAMGAAGSDVALETADMVLMNDKLAHIDTSIRLATRMKRIIRQNLMFAAVVIALLLLSNFVQVINLPLGVIGHEGSTILVILNGLRLLRYKC
jgi:Cd2+/Zn2+-exporting ATPase